MRLLAKSDSGFVSPGKSRKRFRSVGGCCVVSIDESLESRTEIGASSVVSSVNCMYLGSG